MHFSGQSSLHTIIDPRRRASTPWPGLVRRLFPVAPTDGETPLRQQADQQNTNI